MNEFNPLVFANRLKHLRKNVLKLTRLEFSQKTDICEGTLRNYEVGRGSPNSGLVYNICTVCNVSADWLLGLKEDM